MLSDYDWIAGERRNTGGRPSLLYHVNPRAFSTGEAKQRYRVPAGRESLATDGLITQEARTL